MGFLDRFRMSPLPKTSGEVDAMAIRHLQKGGADLSRPRHVIHVIYFPSEEAARAVVETIETASWNAAVEPPTERIAEWSVRADGERVVGPDTISAFRSWFEHVAAEFGQADAARVLLQYGADVSLLDGENDAIALGWAAFFGRPEVVAVLLKGGSQPSQRNKHGLIPLGCAVGGTQGKWKQFSNATWRNGEWPQTRFAPTAVSSKPCCVLRIDKPRPGASQ
jgi:hypothetical protein